VSAELSNQLRALVDAARPVSAGEAIARSQSIPGSFGTGAARAPHRRTRRLGVAAAAVVLALGVGAWLIASESSAPPKAPVSALLRLRQGSVLTDAQLRQIARASAAAAKAGGTASITELREENGIPQDGYEAAVTFSGSNIDEKITSVPEPPGSAGAIAIDDRYVDGQLYTYAVGPDGVDEWLHERYTVGSQTSTEFPNPRILYNVLSPTALFRYQGTSKVGGTLLYRLTALEPVAIDTATVGSFANSGHITAISVWVSANDVVQEIAFRTEAQIAFTPTSSTSAVGPIPTITTASNVLVVFSELGVPQNVTAPSTWVDAPGGG
jgi:hypothetical protein